MAGLTGSVAGMSLTYVASLPKSWSVDLSPNIDCQTRLPDLKGSEVPLASTDVQAVLFVT